MRASTRRELVHGPAGRIECAVDQPESTRRGVALIAHPHPLYGGTLDNKVVQTLARAFLELGYETWRPNFRGVGATEGAHDEGRGELEDARAALRWMQQRYPGARVWLAGFSFGSWIAARLAAEEPAERVILISPPVQRSGFSVLRESAVPKLVIQGTYDVVCPPEALEQEFAAWREPKRLILVPEASHFYDKRLAALADALRQGLLEAAGPRS